MKVFGTQRRQSKDDSVPLSAKTTVLLLALAVVAGTVGTEIAIIGSFLMKQCVAVCRLIAASVWKSRDSYAGLRT